MRAGSLFLAVLAAGCAPLYGPGGPPPAASQAAASAPAVATDEPEGDGPVMINPNPERSPTPSEMASAADAMLHRMTRVLTRFERRHAEAFAANDALRRNCVNECLIRERALISTAEAAKKRLEHAVSVGQLAASQDAFTVVGVAFLKSKLLAAEVRQCMIDPPRIGHTETHVTVEPLERK